MKDGCLPEAKGILFLNAEDYQAHISNAKKRKLDQLPDTFFWKRQLSCILSDDELLNDLGFCPNENILFLVGERGSGKHTTVDAIVQNLIATATENGLDEKDIYYICARTDAFSKSIRQTEAEKRISDLFSPAEDEDTFSIIVLDQLERFEHLSSLMNIAYDNICGLSNAFVIGISEDDRFLTSEIARDSAILHLKKPTLNQRMDFFSKNTTIEKSRLVNSNNENERDYMESFKFSFSFEGINIDELAQMTEGASYGELQRLLDLFLTEYLYQKSDKIEFMPTVFINRDCVMDCMNLIKIAQPNTIPQSVILNAVPTIAAMTTTPDTSIDSLDNISKEDAENPTIALKMVRKYRSENASELKKENFNGN